MIVKILLLMICSTLPIALRCNDVNDDFPERVYMNTSADPCDDFYEYTCGNFKNVYPLDNVTLTIDHFSLLEDKLLKIVNEILSEEDFIDNPQALNKSKSAYKACVDTDYLDIVKNPEKTVVDAENGFPLVEFSWNREHTKYGFNDIGDAVSKYGIHMLFNIVTFTNLANPSTNLLYIYKLADLTPSETSNIRPNLGESYEDIIDKGFLELGEKSYTKSKRNLRTLMPFDIFLRKMALKLRNATQSSLSDEQVFENIDAMVAFTRGVFKDVQQDNVEDFKNSSVTLEELNVWTKEQFNDTVELDWVQFMQHLFANSGVEITKETEVMNYQGFSQFLYRIINLVRVTEEHVVKSYVMMRIFTYLAPESDAESREYLHDYFVSLNYTIHPRWKYCTRKIIDSVGTAGLSFAPTYEYQLRHFNVNYLNQAVEMIEDLQSVFKEIIQNSSWMDADSKTMALEKFSNMITILGHPDVSCNKTDLDTFYENLRICKWDNYGNSIRIKAFKNAYQLSQISKRDRAFWDKSPFEVNAYYNRPNNKMIFPISMLNPVFFGNKNSILDYGRIGSIIGHEMTHGFDSEGMKYGADGTLEVLWTNATMAAFNERTACFVDEYNDFYEPEINSNVNGTLTLNENIADNGGARESYRAMKRMIKKKKIVKGTSEFTPDQLFFIGYGTLWCNNPSVSYLKQMKTNAHTRSKFRVNGVVSNMEEFSEAFSCPVGSKMNPNNKCLLW